MKCPNCKEGEVKEQVNISGFFAKKKDITYFCPLCSWENKKQFKLSKDDLLIENFERSEKATKIPTKIVYTKDY